MKVDLSLGQLRRPFKAPYEPIYRVGASPETLRVSFPKGERPTRLCLNALTSMTTYAWDPASAATHGNPWVANAITQKNYYKLGFTRINAGSSVTLHRLADYATISYVYYPQHVSSHNWSIDKNAHKYSYEFILDNDLEETNPTIIEDDSGTTFWALHTGGTGSYAGALSDDTTTKAKGVNSTKLTVTSGGSYANLGWVHDYGAGDLHNWSSFEFLCLYVYGANTGLTVNIVLRDGDNDSLSFTWIDNFTGFKRMVLPFRAGAEGGTFDYTRVQKIFVYYAAINAEFVSYLDRIILDVGNWAILEAYIPDAVVNSTSPYPFNVYFWGGASYVNCSFWKDDTVANFGRINAKFLDGTSMDQIWSINSQCRAYFKVGESGETKGAAVPNLYAASLTYSAYKGGKKRVAFGYKLPPDDGRDSSTAGISQCKLKFEVNYTDSGDPSGVYGQATYEFENSANNYNGLTNWLGTWLSLFNSTLKQVISLGFSKRPTGLKICADENENILWVEPTLPAGCVVYAGEIHYANQSTDSDSDGVPDFLTAPLGVPGLMKGVPPW